MTRFAYNLIIGLVLVIATLAVGIGPVEAQTGSLRLEGIVWDPSGNPLAGVRMTAMETSSGREYATVSDSDGYYRFLALQPGVYTVTAQTEGFRDVVHRNLYLFTPGSTQENFSFEVATIDKDVGPTSRARTLDSDLAQSLSQRDLEALPLLNRSPLEILPYQAGAQINGGREPISTINGVPLSMHTLRKDGAWITEPENPRLGSGIIPGNIDSLASVQAFTTTATAEYGGGGGSHFVMATRGGTREWHGSAYNYFRNDNLEANEFFRNARGIGRPEFTRNMFGGTLSGKLGERTFFFGSVEINRTREQLLRNRQVLTNTARGGVFQWYRPDDTTRDSSTVQSFDIVENDPRGLGISPDVAALLALTPTPNNFMIGDGLNTGGYQFHTDAHIDQELVNIRVDHDLNARHRLFARFDWNRSKATDTFGNAEEAFPGLAGGRLSANNFSIMAGSDYAFDPTMVNELRVSFIRATADVERPGRTSEPMLSANSWTNPLNLSSPHSSRFPAFEILDNVSRSRNLHAFKFGAALRHTRLGSTDYGGAYPDITFGSANGNQVSKLVGPSEQSEISAGDRMAFENLYNDLLGRVESIGRTYHSDLEGFLPGGSARKRDFALLDFSAFIQDDWKIRRNLTLNLGLRYELQTVPKELNGYQGVLDRLPEVTASAGIADFSLRAGDDWYRGKRSNFAPRAGFAWDVFETGSTVLRGAYGLFYSPLTGGVIRFIDQNSFGFSQRATVYPNSASTDYRLGDSFPMPQQPGEVNLRPEADRSSSIAVLDPDLATPRVHQFHLTLEQRLWGAVWEAGYTRTRGRKLFQYLNLNQPRIEEDFLQAFKELQAYRNSGVPVPETNTLVRIFGTPLAAFDALKGFNFDSGQVGIAADNLDRRYHDRYAGAGVSEFYLRSYPQFDRFIYGTNSAESWHDALRLGVRKSTYNYNLRAHYTWSKSLDTAPTDGSYYSFTADSLQTQTEKAYSDHHRRHVFHLAFDYTFPFGRNPDSDYDFPSWVNALFSGWNFGALWTRTSGAHFSINSGLQTQYSGVYSLVDFDRSTGREVGSLTREAGQVYWVSPSAAHLFSYPEAGQPGNSGRNHFAGPGYSNLDVVLHKKFTFGERHSLQFRMEAYNVFNTAQFALPDTNYSSPTFGSLGSTVGNPRLMQVALRYQF